MKFDLLPFISESFSTNKKTYKKIDNFYKSNSESNLYKQAKNSKWYSHPISQEGSIKQEYYFKKALGLLIDASNNENTSLYILDIIKHAWSYTYTYVKNNNTIQLSNFLVKYIKKFKGIDNISDNEINSNVNILLFLSIQLNKKIDYLDIIYKKTIAAYVKRLKHYNKNYRINIDNVSKDKIKLLRKLELKIKNKGNIGFMPSSATISEEKQEGMFLKGDKLTDKEKYLFAFEYLFDLEEISLIGIVDDDYLSSKEILEIIYCYTQFFEDSVDINFENFIKFMYPAIQIRYLCKEYKKAKKFFFMNFNEKHANEIEKLNIENENIKKSNLILQDENEKLKLEMEKLRRDNKRLNEKIKMNEDNKTELIKLREFMFNISENKETKEDNLQEDINYDKLKKLKAVIIGGYTNWQNKMKKYLPNCKFISPGVHKINSDLIKNIDLIFVYTNCLNHALYFNLLKEIKNKDISIHYLAANINEKITLNQILDFIKEDV